MNHFTDADAIRVEKLALDTEFHVKLGVLLNTETLLSGNVIRASVTKHPIGSYEEREASFAEPAEAIEWAETIIEQWRKDGAGSSRCEAKKQDEVLSPKASADLPTLTISWEQMCKAAGITKGMAMAEASKRMIALADEFETRFGHRLSVISQGIHAKVV